MTARAYFWEDGHARAVAHTLRVKGFDAEVVRDRFAGEDDDEDHPWVVVSDAPPVMLDLLLEEYDGWLDDAQPPPTPSPLELPSGPRRVKGHFRES